MEVLARTSPGGLQSNLPPTVRLQSKLKQVSHGFVYWALKTVMSGESWTSLGNVLQSCTCCTAFLLVKLLLRCGISLFWHCLPLWRIWLSHFCHSPSRSCVLLLASLLLSQAKQTRFPDLSLYNLQSCHLIMLVSVLLVSLQFCSIPFELGVPGLDTVYTKWSPRSAE